MCDPDGRQDRAKEGVPSPGHRPLEYETPLVQGSPMNTPPCKGRTHRPSPRAFRRSALRRSSGPPSVSFGNWARVLTATSVDLRQRGCGQDKRRWSARMRGVGHELAGRNRDGHVGLKRRLRRRRSRVKFRGRRLSGPGKLLMAQVTTTVAGSAFPNPKGGGSSPRTAGLSSMGQAMLSGGA
jgi:hypothetical protein